MSNMHTADLPVLLLYKARFVDVNVDLKSVADRSTVEVYIEAAAPERFLDTQLFAYRYHLFSLLIRNTTVKIGTYHFIDRVSTSY